MRSSRASARPLAWTGAPQRRPAARWRVAAILVVPLALAACAVFAPLREPPRLAGEDPPGPATTRAEAIALFGPPEAVRASDIGEVLVYRRRIVVDSNPSRYYGEDRGDRLDRYELVLLYLDEDQRIVRVATEPDE